MLTMTDSRHAIRFHASTTWQLRTVLILAILAAAWPAAAQGPFAELVRRVPNTANALVLLNVDKVNNSPLAIRSGWKKNQQKAFDDGMVVVPPQAIRFVTAAQIDFEFMQPVWEMILMDLHEVPPMSKIAERHGGREDSINGVPAVALPGDAYVVQFNQQTIGVISPGNRQTVARWLRQAKSRKSAVLSPYLTEAVGFVDNVGTEIIMAIDLEDMIPPAYVREKVRGLKCTADQQVDLDQLAHVLSSIRGVSLGVVIRDRLIGKIKVDFREDASVISGLAKPLILEVLANNGAMIDDFQSWKGNVSGNQMSIEGYFSSSGLRQVLSVIDAPTTDLGDTPQGSSTSTKEAPSETDQVIYASQHYFKTVNRFLRDLRNKKNVRTIAQYGTWFTNYARKIDRLTMLHVDPDLLDFGASTSTSLRDASIAIKGIGMNSRVRQLNITNYGGSGVYRVGAYGARGYVRGYVSSRYDNQRDRVRIRTEEKVTGAKSAIEIMQNIEIAAAKIRRKMTERYQVEF